MRLLYKTGWQRCAVHYRVPGGDTWITQPLGEMRGAPDWKVVDLEKGAAEFVMRNEEGTEWDNPPPELGTKNYEPRTAGCPEGVGTWTLAAGRLMRVVESDPVLIVSDLDHTMVGHEHDPENSLLREFQAIWMGRYAFAGSLLVYSTGRNKNDALKVARERNLLRPDLLVCGVGTEVYEVPRDLPMGPDGQWAEDGSRITSEASWTELMAKSFDRDKVEQVLLEQFPKFDARGNKETDPYRIPTAYEVDAEMQQNFERVREVLGPSVEVISSGGAEWKLVDFCSSSAGKLKACQFVGQKLGIPPERTLVCGDSGNDESMYRYPCVRGVAVGNSLPELVAALEAAAKAGPDAVRQGAVFSTTMDGHVLYASRPVAGAIVEALEHFWPAKW
uniref:Sucrose phosphatase-like domain-containing protein n=1 Tax=Alexandrium catenella TaxID=2925 RepID=A0A7S1LPE9_ALECA